MKFCRGRSGEKIKESKNSLAGDSAAAKQSLLFGLEVLGWQWCWQGTRKAVKAAFGRNSGKRLGDLSVTEDILLSARLPWLVPPERGGNFVMTLFLELAVGPVK